MGTRLHQNQKSQYHPRKTLQQGRLLEALSSIKYPRPKFLNQQNHSVVRRQKTHRQVKEVNDLNTLDRHHPPPLTDVQAKRKRGPLESFVSKVCHLTWVSQPPKNQKRWGQRKGMTNLVLNPLK